MFEFDCYRGPLRDHADYLVIGSGPGGAIAAKTLSESGKKVIVLEAGPYVPPQDLHDDMGRLLAEFFWDGGMRSARGNVVLPTLQARCLGGGSVFNAAICMRAARPSLEKWAEDWGTDDLTVESLAPYYDAVEQFMGVRPTQEAVQGRRNLLFRDACDQLGWTSEPTSRNETDCIGSANCIAGCKVGAKNSMDRRGIPEVIHNGGTVYTSVRVERVVIRGNKVTGIVGYTVDPATRKKVHEVRITADCTILSAGVIANPCILRNSGFKRDPIGGNLRMHPSGMMFGVFDDDVDPWVGATQGYHCTQFLDSEGIKLESLWASASLLSLRFPGIGKQFKRYLSKYKQMAVWDCWVAGEDSIGRVRPLPGGQVDITFNLGKIDVRRLQEGNAKLAEMFAAVGAKQVLTGLHGMPPMMDPAEAVETIRAAQFEAKDFPTGSNHVFGSMAMGSDPARAATDSWGKVHEIEDLYVADTSLFPASPGVNPQLTAMALAHRLGLELPNRY